MFFGSIIIGIFLNGMNVSAYDISHLYLSATLVYSAILMASNMCILEVLMHYSHSGNLNMSMLLLFILMSAILVVMLREQFLVDDNQWLKRMISHHSTALTTSHKIRERTKNEKVRKLATNIIKTQEEEIKLMEDLLR
jgi:hypothetical protein